MNKIVIFGAGGFAREIQQLVYDLNDSLKTEKWNLLGFVVDKQYVSDKLVNGLPILGDETWLQNNPDVYLVIAIGSSELRKRKVKELERIVKNPFAILIHPKAWVGNFVDVGAGSVICAGALITTNISIGKHVHINIGATVGHDAQVNDYVTLNPSVNVSGNVILEESAEVGTGSIIIPKVVVGENTMVGAGSVVIKNLEANGVAVGAPAKIIKKK